jgi:hypothetical protein
MNRRKKKRKIQPLSVTIAERLPAVAEKLGFKGKGRLKRE